MLEITMRGADIDLTQVDDVVVLRCTDEGVAFNVCLSEETSFELGKQMLSGDIATAA